jgi:hypothetical protein
MLNSTGSRVGAAALTIAILFAACKGDTDPVRPQGARDGRDPSTLSPLFTKGTSTSTLLGRATFRSGSQPFQINRRTGDWRIEINSSRAMDIAVQSIDFPAGTHSGWHSHPGPVFIQVVSGTMTFYMADDPSCTPVVKHAGEGYLDLGNHPHIARNETALPAQNVVTYFAPVGAGLRIDEPKPGNCPF